MVAVHINNAGIAGCAMKGIAMTTKDPAETGDLSPTTASIMDVMSSLDGSNTAVVSMMTGLSAAELNDLGSVPED